MNNMNAINILTNLKCSGFMGMSTQEALQYGIECILYVTRVKGAEEQLDKIWEVKNKWN